MHENFSSHFISIVMDNVRRILVGMLSMLVVLRSAWRIRNVQQLLLSGMNSRILNRRIH